MSHWLTAGCHATPRSRANPPEYPFRFPADTLALTNETAWSYTIDPSTGAQKHTPAVPSPTYSLRCFVLARAAKQFHAHAEFQADRPRLDEAAYRRRVQAVFRRSPRTRSQPGERVVFPGFADLHTWSAAYPNLVRDEAGSSWCSYFQRGNWRMILPFTRAGQATEADRLAAEVRAGNTPVVHVTDFPRLGINHGLLLYDVVGGASSSAAVRPICFLAYDPNDPNRPVAITFDPVRRTFVLPPLPYYHGGPVNLYEVYGSALR